jgi:ribose transport system substrate-binding protein
MRSKKLVALAAVASMALVAAACGSDDDSGGDEVETTSADSVSEDTTGDSVSEDTTGDSVSEDTTTVETGDDNAPGLESAQARVDEFSQEVTDFGLTEAVTPPDSLKVAYVQCAVPVCESIRQGIDEAVSALGGELVVFPTEDTADTVQAAFQSAIQSESDMVLTSGNPREWFEAELAELNEAGTPVVGWSIPEGYEPEGFAANLVTGDDYWFNGVLMADYVTVETEGDADVLFMNIPQFPVLSLEQDGFTEEFAAVCPDCSLTALEFTVPQLLAGEHIAAAVSEFQKNPDINFVVTGFGDMLLGMPDALASAGIEVPAISQAGTTLNYEMITSGTMQQADVALPTGFLGWRAIDAGLRALAGQSPGTFEPRPLTDFAGHPDIAIAGVPLQILEADDIEDPTVAFPGIPGYQQLFGALWGI